MGIHLRAFQRHAPLAPRSCASALSAARAAFGTVIAAGVVFGALAGETAPMAVPIAVPTIVVAPASGAASRTEFDATLQPVRQATIAAQASGNVLAVLVKPGDAVRGGQVLARLDARDATAGLARGEAGVAQADAESRNARLAAERSQELHAQGFISQVALDNADTRARAAQAGLQQAQGARRQAALAQDFTTVTAPYGGVVMATHLEAGDLASPGRPIVTVYAPGALRAVVQVPASRASALASAQVELPAAGGQPARWVEPLRRTELPGADPVSQTVEWRLELPPGAPGRPGQSVRVRVASAAVSAGSAAEARPLALPASAVLRRGELTAVYVARDSAFSLRAVRAGAATGDGQVAVLAGLKPGEQVAADAQRAGLAGAVPSR
jgi:RND family efflux transporter MFP subunit